MGSIRSGTQPLFTSYRASNQHPVTVRMVSPCVLGLQILEGHFAHGVRQECREGRHVQLQFLDVRVQGDLLYMVSIVFM